MVLPRSLLESQYNFESIVIINIENENIIKCVLSYFCAMSRCIYTDIALYKFFARASVVPTARNYLAEDLTNLAT